MKKTDRRWIEIKQWKHLTGILDQNLMLESIKSSYDSCETWTVRWNYEEYVTWFAKKILGELSGQQWNDMTPGGCLIHVNPSSANSIILILLIPVWLKFKLFLKGKPVFTELDSKSEDVPGKVYKITDD